jgi:hypothetical protein
MTDRPPMTDAELLDLSGVLDDLCRQIPALGDSTAAAYLAESDFAALHAAKIVIDRLYRWTHWPTLAAASGSYLPAPVPVAEPQSLRVQS